jgi:outer membrane receptor protein involved in Fe transport
VEGTAGTKQRYEVRAGVSLPLIRDRLFVHLGAIYRDWGGFYDNQNPNGPELNRQRTKSLNGLLRWTPSDRFEASLRVNVSRDDDTTAAAFLVPANVAPTLLNGGGLGFFRGEAPKRPPNGVRCCTASAGVEGFERDTFRAALTMSYDLADDLRLTSITAHNKEDQLYDQDVDYTAQDLFTFGNLIDREDFSQELRLSYNSGPVNALLGAFYYDFDNRFENYGYAQFFLPPPRASRTRPAPAARSSP